jgi:hypothetical protein
MDAKQLGALGDSLTPRSFGGPSNDKEPVNTGKKLSKEHRERIAAAGRRRWARVDPERRKEIGASMRAAVKKKRQLTGSLKGRGAAAIPSWVEPEFDEMGF